MHDGRAFLNGRIEERAVGEVLQLARDSALAIGAPSHVSRARQSFAATTAITAPVIPARIASSTESTIASTGV